MLNVHPVGNAVTRGGARPLRRRLSCGLLAFSRGQAVEFDTGKLSSLIRASCRVSSVPRDGTLLGSLFESLACLSVRTFAQASGGRTHHLREKDGRREVDFVVEQDAGIIAFEVKLSATVDDRDVRHLLWLRDEVGDDLRDLVILTTGPEAYRRAPVEPERLARLHDFGARLTAGDPELVARIESIDPGEEQNQGNL